MSGEVEDPYTATTGFRSSPQPERCCRRPQLDCVWYRCTVPNILTERRLTGEVSYPEEVCCREILMARIGELFEGVDCRSKEFVVG